MSSYKKSSALILSLGLVVCSIGFAEFHRGGGGVGNHSFHQGGNFNQGNHSFHQGGNFNQQGNNVFHNGGNFNQQGNNFYHNGGNFNQQGNNFYHNGANINQGNSFYRNGGVYNPGNNGVVVGAPIQGYYGGSTPYTCPVVQQCYPNGNCVQTQVCN